MKSQWVVETKSKSRWGWNSFFKTEAEAKLVYEQRRKDKSFISVTIYKESWKA